jgi:hypothetical protein
MKPQTLGAVFLVACAASACHNDLPTARLMPGLTPSFSVAAVELPWNEYSADVVVHRQVSSRSRGVAPLDLSYHLDRRSTPSGGWATTMALLPRRVLGARNPLPPRDVISRIESADDAPGIRVYDGLGRLIPASTPEMLQQAEAVRRADPSSGFIPLNTATHGQPHARGNADRRAWADHFIVTPAAGQRMKARLILAFGPSRVQVRGLDRYVRTTADRVSEVLADPQTGAILESNETRGGQLVLHVTHEYTVRADGAQVRTSTRVERAVASSPTPDVTTTTYANVQLANRS